jgi:hypothetical protein
MKIAIIHILVVVLVGVCSSGEAGHELPYYPSFYPQEIRIETVDPHAAAARLAKAAIHVYIGDTPVFGETIPDSVHAVQSLGSYLVLTFNPQSERTKNKAQRCAFAQTIATRLRQSQKDVLFHPYPVTPYHRDYLYHFDRIESAKKDYQAGDPHLSSVSFKVRTKGKFAEQLVQNTGSEAEWDALVEEIDVNHLIVGHSLHINGWFGPPWLKEGWFHAYLLLASWITEDSRKESVYALYQRLTTGTYQGLTERLNLERQLVSLLTQGCARVVLGYTVRREYLNAEYSAGIENTAIDSHTGLHTPLFLRTVKLKDFPWNGWLRVGLATKPAAAWNPIGGFTDAAGRLLWFAVGDPAFLPAPTNSSWLPNRIRPDTTVETPPAGVQVPRDAVLPALRTGVLQVVGETKRAQAKITYRIFTSKFHDQTPMTVADLLYPYIFAWRWSERIAQQETEYDPFIAQATAFVRERLAGIQVIRVDREIKNIGELQVLQETPIIEVYINYTALDPQHIASLAPPWSTLPWQLLVLMEEVVKRGWAAFSQEEAQRRGVVWLDLARNQALRDQMTDLVEEFARQGYRPDTLQDFVTVTEARERWAALQQFAQEHGHFLVTNGPYRLEQWTEDTPVLQVFRDLSFPLGVGTFDRYVFPPRATNLEVTLRPEAVHIQAMIEKIEKVQRDYITVKEALRSGARAGIYPVTARAHYLVVDPQGAVFKTGTASPGDDGGITIALSRPWKPGLYSVVLALFLNENFVHPEVQLVQYPVP